MKCPKCGAESPGKYCSSCGSALPSMPPLNGSQASFQAPNPMPVKKSNTALWVIVSIILTVFVMIILFVPLFTAQVNKAKKEGTTSDTTSETTTTTLSLADFKDSCQSISYDQLARNPDKYKGENYVLTGKVIQAVEENGIVNLRVNVTKGDYGLWSDTIYVVIDLPKDADRILEDDVVTIWGTCGGLYEYTSVMGAKIQLPLIYGKYHEIVE